MSFPLVKYVLMAALRDKLVISMLISFVVGASLSLFLGSAAIVEKDAFSLVFAASALRLISVFGLVLFIIFFVRRSFESKDIEFLLSRPVGRVSIIFSYAFAFLILAVLVSVAVGGVLFAIAPHLFGVNHICWLITIAVEAVIMVNIAFFFSMQISSAASASMLTVAFYVLGRMMGQLLGIVDSDLVDGSGLFAMTLQLVSVITPRLDLLGQSSWLLYGVSDFSTIIYAVAQGVVFSFLVLCAASLDFIRRQF